MFIFSQCLPPQRWQPAVLWWKSCSFLSHQLHCSTKSFYWLSSFATRSQWKTNINQITQERLQGLGQSDTLPLGTLSKLPYCTSSHSTCVLIYFFTKIDAKLNLSCIGVNCQSYSQQQFSTITTMLCKKNLISYHRKITSVFQIIWFTLPNWTTKLKKIFEPE